MDEKSNFYIVAMIAIVAVVALTVMLITNGKHTSQYSASNIADNAGQAIKPIIKNDAALNAPVHKIEIARFANSQGLSDSTQSLLATQNDGDTFAIQTNSKTLQNQIISNKGFTQGKFSPGSYNRTIHVNFTSLNIMPNGARHEMFVKGYQRNAGPDDSFTVVYMSTTLPGSISVAAPDGAIDLYFTIWAYAPDIHGVRQKYFFTAIAHMEDGFDYANVDLNNLVYLPDNFYDISSIRGFTSPDHFGFNEIFERGRSSYIISFSGGNERILFYGPSTMTQLSPTMAYIKPPIGASSHNDLLVYGDFYNSSTPIPGGIIIKGASIKKTRLTVDTTSHNIPSSAPYSTVYMNYNGPGWNVVITDDLTNAVDIEYLNNIPFFTEHFYSDQSASNYIFDQQTDISSSLMPEGMYYLKSPLIGRLVISGLYIHFILNTGDLNVGSVATMPESTRITLTTPDGQEIYGTGTFSIYCGYPQYTNPPLPSCMTGNYKVIVDNSATVKTGEKIFYGRIYYNGNSWTILN